MSKLFVFVGCALFAGFAFAQSPSRGADKLAQMDTNADGSITREEFMSAREQMFDKRDRNSDGVLDSNDFGKRAARRGGQRMEEMLERLDTDKDGRVTREEFVSAEAPLFTRADQDSNGILDAAEIEKAKNTMQSMAHKRRAQ